MVGRRLWRVGFLTALPMLMFGKATAAELPIAAPPIPVPLWTGFYAGPSVGGSYSQKTFIDNFPTPDGAIDATPHPAGLVGGLQAGYNYQIDSLLVGIEGDFTWLGARSQFSCFSFGAQTCTADPEWIGSIVGRVGAVFGPVLIYGKGGPAWVSDTYTDVAAKQAVSGGVQSLPGDLFVGHDIRPGWTVGGGIEYMFLPSWSIRLEYDYAQFRDRSVDFYGDDGGFFTELIKQNLQMATVGVNYHFGVPGVAPAPAPIIAKAPQEHEQQDHVLAFATLDVGKWSVDGVTGALIAPSTDLDTSGVRYWIAAGAGGYKYPGQGTLFNGVYTTGEALAGYGFEGDNYSINVLAGLNAINDMVNPHDPDNKVVGTEGGVKVRADAYLTPTPETMTYGEAEYSTAFSTYYASQRVGYDVTNGNKIYVGPIASILGDERFNQWRVGGHISNVQVGKLELDFSAGYANDSVVGAGAFGTVEASMPF